MNPPEQVNGKLLPTASLRFNAIWEEKGESAADRKGALWDRMMWKQKNLCAALPQSGISHPLEIAEHSAVAAPSDRAGEDSPRLQSGRRNTSIFCHHRRIPRCQARKEDRISKPLPFCPSRCPKGQKAAALPYQPSRET